MKSVRQRKKNIYDITFMWKLKNKQTNKQMPNECIHKAETDSQIWKTNLWLPNGRGKGERNKLGVWD